MSYRFRHDQLSVTQHKSGTIVYFEVEDPKRGVKHRLYELEFAVAQLLDGRRGLDKIAKTLQKRHGLQAEAVDVQSFVQQLVALGFVEEI